MPDRSLASLFPRCLHMPLGLLAALALIISGQWLPVLKIEKFLFWESNYSLVDGASSLAREGHWFLAGLLVVFSIIFPIVKLFGLLLVWYLPLAAESRELAIRMIDLLGRWSMLDVFVVAVTIVIASSKATLGASAREGLYIFTAGVVLSMVMSFEIERLARKASGRCGGTSG